MLVARMRPCRSAAAAANRFARASLTCSSWPAVASGLCAVGLCCVRRPSLALALSTRETPRWEDCAAPSDLLRQMLISKGAPQVEELSWDGDKLLWLWRRLWHCIDGSWVRVVQHTATRSSVC